MEALKFIFSSFWIFLGFLILIGIPFRFMFGVFHKLIRARTIRKMGYPPIYCDGDGDFKKEEDKK